MEAESSKITIFEIIIEANPLKVLCLASAIPFINFTSYQIIEKYK